ncbi:MAG: MBL fold metallo-hydrolase [Coriobacteriia bacterium]|nr:MBL fold metallo-hydrolase [Coriobacteriia bacterium]
MSMTQVFDNPSVFQIEVPMIDNFLATVNCYVVESEGKYLIIDSGSKTKEAYAVIKQVLDELAIDYSSTQVFLTHPHFDHAGLVSQLVSPDAPVYLSAYDYQLTSQEKNILNEALYLKRLIHEGVDEKAARSYKYLHTFFRLFDDTSNRLVYVQAGDSIELGAFSFQVLSASGHTPDQLALYEESSGLYFCGDQVLEQLNPSIDVSFDGLDLTGNNIARLQELLERKLILMPGHGRVNVKPQERIQKLLDHHLKRREEFKRTIAENPGRSGFEIVRAAKWSADKDWSRLSPIIQSLILRQGFSNLDHLKNSGEIEQSIQNDKYYYFIQ